MMYRSIYFPQVLSHSPSVTPGARPDKKAKAVTRRAGGKPTVLVVDDEVLIADSIAEILNDNGYDATPVYGGEAAVEAASRMEPDIVLTDVLMPKLNGVDAARRIAEKSAKTRILLFSGNAGTTDLLRKAVDSGIDFKLLPKPIHPEQLLKALAGLLHS